MSNVIDKTNMVLNENGEVFTDFTFNKLHSVSMKSNIVSMNNTINITVINGIGTKPTK